MGFIQGHCQQAYIYRQEGLALARQQGDEEEILAHLIGMGASVGTVEIGLAPAEDIFLQALALARKLKYLEPLCVILINLGDLERQEGTPQALRKAEQYLQEGVQIAETIGLQEWLAILLLTSAAVKIKQRR